MTSILSQLAAEHSIGFVFAAGVICTVAGWLLADVLVQAGRTTKLTRLCWLAGAAAVAGLGTWTTHFMAMLGYRRDVLLSFMASTTFVSVLISMIAVGVPLALSVLVKRRSHRIILGACSGLGIAAMHLTGMAAIEGCTQVQALSASIAACVVGALFMGMARNTVGIPRTRTSILFTLAVCGTHFTAIAGTSITDIVSPGDVNEHVTLSIFTIAGAAVLLVGAFLSLIVARRFDTVEKAHSTILSTALENMSNGLVFIDAEERLGLWNKRFHVMFGIDQDRLKLGMTVHDFIDVMGESHGWDATRRELATSRIRDWLASTTTNTIEYQLEGGRVVETEFRPVDSGGAVITFDDVTSDRAAQTRIENLAYYDTLTGLSNRRSLQDKMEEGFHSKDRYKLLLIDLDRFKAVNDTYGHGVGDKLLIDVAGRIRKIVGKDGFAARLGGDEMATLVYGDMETARGLAEEIVEAIARPFLIGSASISIGCSIGMCCTDDASSPEELMQRSDLALYESKRLGRGMSSCYTNGLQEAVTERHRMENDLRNALLNGEFHLAYQPVMRLSDDRIVGYEALIRWKHPVRGNVSPEDFIPMAEETGQILEIGKWVLDEACREAASWPGDLHVAVNVSPVQFRSPLLPSHVTSALAASGLPAHRLEVELTETAIVSDGPQIAKVLEDMRILGIKVAMDDFGTGYSSLAHLRDLPLDRIKIDKSFVAGAATDIHSMAVLKAITQMGRDMSIPTLAEGVETESQLELMRTIGCDAVQGFLIGRPTRMKSITSTEAPRRLA